MTADAAQIQSLLTEQPVLLEIQRKNTYESVKETLQTWLSPEEPEEGAIIDDEDEVEAVTAVAEQQFNDNDLLDELIDNISFHENLVKQEMIDVNTF